MTPLSLALISRQVSHGLKKLGEVSLDRFWSPVLESSGAHGAGTSIQAGGPRVRHVTSSLEGHVHPSGRCCLGEALWGCVESKGSWMTGPPSPAQE